MIKKPLAYISAAWSGTETENMEAARRYCRAVYEAGFSPICPRLYLPLFIDDAIINNLPPDATMNDRANALIDFVEKDGQRLGDGERRLIVYYAEQVQDTGKLAALVDELAGTGYEQEHGQLNYLVSSSWT